MIHIGSRTIFHISGQRQEVAELDAVTNVRRFPLEWSDEPWSADKRAAAATQQQLEADAVAGGPLPKDWRQFSLNSLRSIALRLGAPHDISDAAIESFVMSAAEDEGRAHTAREAFVEAPEASG
jgi:hypothetical protein